ncbi:DUF4149 domain-containing protein [Actimicrobium sp. CCC2.4]|uniref:DUF4149 domain-containing protein n=1 Tax=Actimicrobium sp. CCC2.4 TaxID=3048606 RepID=UPI002AC99ADD|nr:DUF4149 domain-containing protein [Actimicrobium sp. CCC2.4]WPX32612.1 DUF4149 domain-containing protein [Actimicrobium sp. CCC2.4]
MSPPLRLKRPLLFLMTRYSGMTHSLAVLATALLFGGMTLYAFGFAALLFSVLPTQTAGATLRRAFPWFYVFVMAAAAVAALAWWSHDITAAMVMAGIALSTLPVRQLLMPAINRATDTGHRQRFKWLHGLSVLVTIAHIVAAGWVLARLV